MSYFWYSKFECSIWGHTIGTQTLRRVDTRAHLPEYILCSTRPCAASTAVGSPIEESDVPPVVSLISTKLIRLVLKLISRRWKGMNCERTDMYEHIFLLFIATRRFAHTRCSPWRSIAHLIDDHRSPIYWAYSVKWRDVVVHGHVYLSYPSGALSLSISESAHPIFESSMGGHTLIARNFSRVLEVILRPGGSVGDLVTFWQLGRGFKSRSDLSSFLAQHATTVESDFFVGTQNSTSRWTR